MTDRYNACVVHYTPQIASSIDGELLIDPYASGPLPATRSEASLPLGWKQPDAILAGEGKVGDFFSQLGKMKGRGSDQLVLKDAGKSLAKAGRGYSAAMAGGSMALNLAKGNYLDAFLNAGSATMTILENDAAGPVIDFLDPTETGGNVWNDENPQRPVQPAWLL